MRCPACDLCPCHVTPYSIDQHYREGHPNHVMKSPKFTVSQSNPRNDDKLLVIFDMALIVQIASRPEEQLFIFGVKYIRNPDQFKSYRIQIVGTNANRDPTHMIHTPLRELKRYDRRTPEVDKFSLTYQHLRDQLNCTNFLFELVWFDEEVQPPSPPPPPVEDPFKITICQNFAQGCFALNVKDYEHHRKICEYTLLECPSPNMCPKVKVKDMREHFQQEHRGRLDTLRAPKIKFLTGHTFNCSKFYACKDLDVFFVAFLRRNDFERFLTIRIECLWDCTGGTAGDLYYRFNITNLFGGCHSIIKTDKMKMGMYKDGTTESVRYELDNLKTSLCDSDDFVFEFVWWWEGVPVDLPALELDEGATADVSSSAEDETGNHVLGLVRKELECPICMEDMQGVIHNCRKGHSLCSNCRQRIHICPVCKSKYEGGRNFALERLSEQIAAYK